MQRHRPFFFTLHRAIRPSSKKEIDKEMSSGRKGRSGPNKGKKKGMTLGRALMRDRKKKPRSHREKARMRMLYNHTTETVRFATFFFFFFNFFLKNNAFTGNK